MVYLNSDLSQYGSQEVELPNEGKQILGSFDEHNIVVYQAFNAKIADYAVQNQKFGGDNYSFNRMSWIKPGFLWMMFRSGWATKENQERILAIEISNTRFIEILTLAVHSSFQPEIYTSKEAWKAELENSEVRLQWDPDHDPFGNKKNRKAIQLGMKGDILRRFGTNWITSIKDITPFVTEQRMRVRQDQTNKLLIPTERVFEVASKELRAKLGIETEHNRR